LPGVREDCWICQNLHTPPHLVYYESQTSIAKLNPDQLFHGYTFLALKWHEEELHQLTDKDRKLFLDDMTLVGGTLAKVLGPDKMNYELLGNIQRHLHCHIIPRYTSDPMWGRPIWAGSKRRKHLTTDEYRDLVNKIKQQLSIPAKTTQHTRPSNSKPP
jgi:diadenosine tetraphosphate (Ap4A) HIT family hydrolase